ncbi:hypothetical protein EKN06_00495 [Croceicoccus ponticola]|uniref:Periplasmic binding protein domain-containing protein n=1 Tax=Croceicoccus ponticola TaxID=2217664 RepID=A0A437GZG1_9SPHN|nr:hypothetical protein [Croceicoccus ponticola]RVQ68748.1 hypothetical protein EKN06_00495 [Croceicoccus ponticola]
MKLIFVFAAFFAVSIASPTWALNYSQGYTGGNCSTCSWIAADGEIAEGDAQSLLDYIKANKIDYEKLIMINSGGGNVAAAIELGKLIRQRGMRVTVARTTEEEPEGAGRTFQAYEGGTCASACVFVLMAGEVREIVEDSVVGVHQFAPTNDDFGSIASTTSSTQSIIAMLQAYAVAMGVNPAILTLASSISPDDMLWLEPQQMERLDLLTTRNYKNEAEWELRPAGSQLVARASQEQTNGRTTGLVVACRSLHVFFEVTSKQSDEIAKSIKGAEFTMDHTRWSLPLTIVDVAVRNDLIQVSFEGGPKVLEAIARANGSLNIDMDMPWVYYDEFGGFEHDIPTSNIEEMTPHIVSSCR